MEVGDRWEAVLLVDAVHRLLAADVEHDRDARLLRLRPHPVEADVALAVLAPDVRGDHQRGGAEVDRLARALGGAVDVRERHVADGQQPPIDAAEVDHPTVVAGRQRVRQLDVVAAVEGAQRAEVGRREHELAGDAEEVERLRPVAVPDRSEGEVVLAEHDLLRVLGPELGVVLLGERLLEERRRSAGRQLLPQRLAVLRVGVLLGVPGRLEDVRVGVVDGPAFDIGHGQEPRNG